MTRHYFHLMKNKVTVRNNRTFGELLFLSLTFQNKFNGKKYAQTNKTNYHQRNYYFAFPILNWTSFFSNYSKNCSWHHRHRDHDNDQAVMVVTIGESTYFSIVTLGGDVRNSIAISACFSFFANLQSDWKSFFFKLFFK